MHTLIRPVTIPVSSPRSSSVLPGRAQHCPVLFQTWKNLLFLHWSFSPSVLSHHLPPHLALDLFADKAWLGIIPFEMRRVRPRGLPSVPGISNFLELNVRTYVRDRSGTRGVWFFSLDASSRIACTIARSRFHLPYRDAAMRTAGRRQVFYSARRRGTRREAIYRYEGVGSSSPASPGSLDHFLLERYLLFASPQGSSRLLHGRVHHDPYQLRRVELAQCSTLPLEWNGLPQPASASPDHACLVDGVDVSVSRLKPLPDPSNPAFV